MNDGARIYHITNQKADTLLRCQYIRLQLSLLQKGQQLLLLLIQ